MSSADWPSTRGCHVWLDVPDNKQLLPSPQRAVTDASNQLLAATCTSASNCWRPSETMAALNGGVGTIRNEALHWN
jgi:hypothetical protein